jgi:hypothetical protein
MAKVKAITELKMLVIKVELHSAISGEVSTLQTLVIANSGKVLDGGPYEFQYTGWLLKPGFELQEGIPMRLQEVDKTAVVRSDQRDEKGEFIPPTFLVTKVLRAMGHSSD